MCVVLGAISDLRPQASGPRPVTDRKPPNTALSFRPLGLRGQSTAVCNGACTLTRSTHVSSFDTLNMHVFLLYTVLDYLAGYVESRFFDSAVVVLLTTTNEGAQPDNPLDHGIGRKFERL